MHLLMRDHLFATTKILFATIITQMHTALRTHPHQSFYMFLVAVVYLLMRDHFFATTKILFTTSITHMHTALRMHPHQSCLQYLHPVHTFGAHSHSFMHAQMYECITHISTIAQDTR